MSVDALAALAETAQDEAQRILDRAARRLLAEKLAERQEPDTGAETSS